MGKKSAGGYEYKTDDEQMGRPRKEINLDQFEQLCQLQCTLDEIAGFFHVSKDTIERRIAEHYVDEDGNPRTFADVRKEYSAGGLISLRREQYASAVQRGNTAMLIWLGKQHLGQLDDPPPQTPATDSMENEYDIRQKLYED